MNEHVKPAFLAYIEGLEQSELVGMLTDLVNNRDIKERMMAHILTNNGVEFPKAGFEVISQHNFKRIEVSYQSNYNGCSISVLETKDGQSTDDYEDTDEYREIYEKIENVVVSHAVDETSEEGTYYGDIDTLEEEVIYMVKQMLGDDVEVAFDEDSIST